MNDGKHITEAGTAMRSDSTDAPHADRRFIAHELLTLCLRLCMEPTDSHAPETMAVLDRWRKAWEEAAGGMDFDQALTLVPEYAAVPQDREETKIAVTESEIEQATKYGNRIIFEKGGVITVADVLAARHLLAAAPEPVHAPGAIDQRDRFGMSAAPASGKGEKC